MMKNKALKENTKMSDVLYMKSKGVSVAHISKTTGVSIEKTKRFLKQVKDLKKQSGIF